MYSLTEFFLLSYNQFHIFPNFIFQDLNTSESISAKPNKETLNFEHFPEKLISNSAPNTQNTKKLENLVKKELETPFIVHAEINKVHTYILHLQDFKRKIFF